MKTKILLTATVLSGFAASVQTAGIVGTKHDLSSGTTATKAVHSTTQAQTCVFCHVPHNAVTGKLLWNRNAGAGGGAAIAIYTSYNSQAMRGALAQNTLGNDSSSLLCLSCHSLGSAAAVISNTANNKGGTPAPYDGATFPAVTGNKSSLINDHPVGINYDAAQSVATAKILVPSTDGKVGKLRLFKSAGGSNTMECASCHSVHDNANTNFLAISNANSALCMTCHVK